MRNLASHARVERAELVALTGVLTLIARNLSERATRERVLADAVGGGGPPVAGGRGGGGGGG